MTRISMIFYNKQLEKELTQNGFYKYPWDGKRKVLCRDVDELVDNHKPKTMIVPNWHFLSHARKFYRVYILLPNLNSINQLELSGVPESMVLEVASTIEKIFKQRGKI